MASFKNFSIWQGKLPHWRADDVTYYVTFRHSRALNEKECRLLLDELLKADAKRLDFLIACCLPTVSETMFTVREGPDGEAYELADVIEKAKTRAGKKILKLTQERWPPFYGESYDRIVRDDAELEQRWTEILESPVKAELCEDPEEYAALYVRDRPE